jgi:dTDP-4-dehydrorhamnose reductase
VHPSTDCVFRGDLGLPYPSSTPPDAVDAYGWSKLQAERVLSARPNTLIIRTSIIGPSVGPASGLLQWFLSQPQGARLSGYTNHFWNGLTTLQWCTEVERLLGEFDGSTSRLIQFASPDALSKHDMLLMFKDIFRQDISITAVEHAQRVDRRLHADIDVPSLVRQLEQLRDWMETA